MALLAENGKFSSFTERFVHELLALAPVGASATGYHRHTDPQIGKTIQLDELLDDYSADGLQKRRALLAELRRELTLFTADKLGAAERIDLAVMRSALDEAQFDLDKIEAHRHNPTVYTNLLGYAIFEPMVHDYAPLEVRLGHILSRLDGLPVFLDAARKNLADTDPVYTQAAVDGTQGNISLLENQLKQLVEQSGSEALGKRYAATVPRSTALLRDFIRFLKEDLAKHSTGSWRLGAALYPEKLRYALGTDLSPAEVLAKSERALADLRAEMLRLAMPMHQGLYPSHGAHAELAGKERENEIIREVLDKIAEEHPARNALLEEARKNLDELRSFLREKDFVTLPTRDNLQVIETPPFIRNAYGVGGFASAPALEPALGAYYWVTPIPEDWSAERAESKLREYNRYTFKILSLHEALPGHYLQFEHANDIVPASRRLLRNVLASGTYVEGWAVYMEGVMLDNGFLDGSPKLKLMQLKWTLRAVANAILDVRLHTQGMTDQQALDLMMVDVFQERAEAEAKMIRAKLSVAQLPTYFVGLLEWRSIREAVQRAEGGAFREKEFHGRALAAGPIPMVELRRWMLATEPPKPGKGRAE